MEFVAGALGGLLSSMPLGPINWTYLSYLGLRAYRPAFFFIAGVLSADLLIAGAALSGSQLLVFSAKTLACLGLFFGAMLVAYAASLLKSQAHVASLPVRAGYPLFALGFSFCVVNPSFFLFWVTYLVSCPSFFGVKPTTMPAFLSGVFVGDVIWFAAGACIFRAVASRYEDPLAMARRFVAFGFLVAALFVIVGALRNLT